MIIWEKVNEMAEITLLCKKCRNVFYHTVGDSCPINKRTACPACGSFELYEAPVWAPIGSGLNIFEGSDWEYECHECHHKFEMPIPKSPTENKQRKCPVCGSGQIERVTIFDGLPLWCG
jgi:rRNA maturation endonuclease Nob1